VVEAPAPAAETVVEHAPQALEAEHEPKPLV
jgi:ribonuclease E